MNQYKIFSSEKIFSIFFNLEKVPRFAGHHPALFWPKIDRRSLVAKFILRLGYGDRFWAKNEYLNQNSEND